MVMREFWDKAHREQNLVSLSGTSGHDELYTLEINSVRDQNMLIIGVGTGSVIRHCVARGAKVSALDISPVALENVQDLIVLGYLPHAELPENAFDLILSANVAQHISHDDFEIQTQKVLRSLKVGGTYALQFIHIDTTLASDHEMTAGYRDDEVCQQWGAVSRSPGRVKQLVGRCGGLLVKMSTPRQSEINNLFAYTVHIRRA